MNNAQLSARVGLFFLIGVALIWIVFEMLNRGKVGRDDGYLVRAAFDNVKELKAGDDVRLAGVKVGSVTGTKLEGRRAVALLLLDKDVRVPADSVATIAMAGLLGSNYIAIALGGENSPTLVAGGELRTRPSGDLNTLMAQIGDLGTKLEGALSGFSGAMGGVSEASGGGGGLFQKLDALVAENRETLRGTLANLQEITDKINRGDGTLGRLVSDPTLHDELLVAVGQIRDAAQNANLIAADARGLISDVKAGKGTLGMLLTDETAAENLRLVSQNLSELSTKLNRGEGTLGKLLNDDSLYREAQGVIRRVDRAVDGLSDQGPLSAVGVAANALF